jgi:catechol 2,3-dioxygenase-like lactoylglutathione lyase family enzyme
MTIDLGAIVPGQPHANRTGTINHLRLTVSDIARAKAFYDPLLQRLGYALVEASSKRLAWASWAPHGLLQWFVLSIADPESPNKAHDRYSPGFHHLAWNVNSRAEVDEIHRALSQTGVGVLEAPAEYDYEPGYYAFFFSDPDGLKLEVMHLDVAANLSGWSRFLEEGVETNSVSDHPQIGRRA